MTGAAFRQNAALYNIFFRNRQPLIGRQPPTGKPVEQFHKNSKFNGTGGGEYTGIAEQALLFLSAEAHVYGKSAAAAGLVNNLPQIFTAVVKKIRFIHKKNVFGKMRAFPIECRINSAEQYK